MKTTIRRIIIIYLFIFLGVNSVYGDHPSPHQDKYTLEILYSAFQFISPKDMIEFTRKAARHMVKVGKEKAFADFNKAFPTIWYTHRFGLHIGVIDCAMMSIAAYPVPELKHIVGIPNFLINYKDAEGKRMYIKSCKNIPNNPNGLFIDQLNSWGIDGVKEPVRSILAYVPVKGTPYTIFTISPFPPGTANVEDLNKLIKAGKL